MKNGKLIVIEGLDGSGKSSQGELLHTVLPNSVVGHAPTSGNELSVSIRKELSIPSMDTEKEELFLSYLMHADRIYQTWNLKDGIYKTIYKDKKHYISIRYSISSKVYNSKEMDTNELLKPDILIFLDLTPEDSFKRIIKRSSCDSVNIERYENLEKLTEVREKYLSEIKKLEDNGQAVLIINANQEIGKIHNEIKSYIDKII